MKRDVVTSPSTSPFSSPRKEPPPKRQRICGADRTIYLNDDGTYRVEENEAWLYTLFRTFDTGLVQVLLQKLDLDTLHALAHTSHVAQARVLLLLQETVRFHPDVMEDMIRRMRPRAPLELRDSPQRYPKRVITRIHGNEHQGLLVFYISSDFHSIFDRMKRRERMFYNVRSVWPRVCTMTSVVIDLDHARWYRLFDPLLREYVYRLDQRHMMEKEPTVLATLRAHADESDADDDDEEGNVIMS